MSFAIDTKTLFAGYLNTQLTKNPTAERIEFSFEGVAGYTKQLWNAGCGPIIADFTKKELKEYLDSLPMCRAILDGNYRVLMSNFPPDEEAEKELGSRLSAVRLKLFLKLKAHINYPYLLLHYMGFGCFYITPPYE